MGGTHGADGDKNGNSFGETRPALGKMYAGQPPDRDRYRTGGAEASAIGKTGAYDILERTLV